MTIRRDEHHRYWLEDGYELTSVTTLLTALNLYEAPYGAGDEHRERGSAVHVGIQYINQGVWSPDGTDPRILPRLLAYQQWMQQTKFRPVLVEEIVGSGHLGVAGTLDMAGFFEDAPDVGVVVDAKSGQPDAAVAIQTALYAILAETSHGFKTHRRMSLWLRATGDFRVKWHDDPQDFRVAMSAVSVYRWRRKFGKLPAAPAPTIQDLHDLPAWMED